MHRFLYLVFLLSFAAFGQIQVKQTARYQLDREFGEENFIIVSAEERGIMLFRESDEKVENQKGNVWQVIHVDNELEEQWDKLFVVDYDYSIIGYEYFDGGLFLLFEDLVGRNKKYYILKIALDDGGVNTYETISEFDLTPTHLLINHEQMVLAGEINYRLSFIIFDYVNDKVIVVPGFFNRKTIILDFNYNKKHKVYSLLLGARNAQGNYELVLKSFNAKGEVFIDESYQFDESKRALNGKVVIGEDMRVYFAGSYGAHNSYYSHGMYFGYLESGKSLEVKFHTLRSFEHILDYMSTRRAARIRRKIERGEARGKPYDFKSQLWVQHFYEKDNELILLSDIYRPEYDASEDARYGNSDKEEDFRTNQKYVSYTPGISNVEGSTSVEYYEALLLRFDKNGKLLSDVSLPTPNAEMFDLERLTASYVDGDKAGLLYKDENNIRYKLFTNKTEVLSDSAQQVNVFEEGSTLNRVTDEQGRLQEWYDNHFFIWGYQSIDGEYRKKERVFFINKITIEE